MRRTGIPLILLALACAHACHCEPRKTPSRSSRSAPEPPPRKASAPRHGLPLDLEMDSSKDGMSECGECCSVRELSTTHVSLAMLADLTVQAVDTGTVTHVETTSGLQMQTSRTWSFHWSGTWRTDGSRRVATLKLLTSSCTETFSVREPAKNTATDEERDCPVASSALQLVCVSGQVPAAVDGGTDTAAGGEQTIWMCGEDGPSQHPGSPLPWRLVPAAD